MVDYQRIMHALQQVSKPVFHRKGDTHVHYLLFCFACGTPLTNFTGGRTVAQLDYDRYLYRNQSFYVCHDYNQCQKRQLKGVK